MPTKANSGKKTSILINKDKYLRLPIKTHIISSKDNVFGIIDKYVISALKQNDIIIISERIVSIIQKRSYLIKDIKPSPAAKFLYKFVTSHPGGIGLRSPWTMELAIKEAGLIRILIAGFFSALTKPLGIKGLFYHLAGHNIAAIDGPCDYSLPPSNISAKLGPKNPQQLVDKLTNRYQTRFVIIDANDYGVAILAASEGVNKDIVKKAFKDNPMGQSRQQTPLAILRKK